MESSNEVNDGWTTVIRKGKKILNPLDNKRVGPHNQKPKHAPSSHKQNTPLLDRAGNRKMGHVVASGSGHASSSKSQNPVRQEKTQSHTIDEGQEQESTVELAAVVAGRRDPVGSEVKSDDSVSATNAGNQPMVVKPVIPVAVKNGDINHASVNGSSLVGEYSGKDRGEDLGSDGVAQNT
ncbi:hypothetical protein PIB30_024458 [Stylosanthes scabra]|uniref:Uncharacterized protein n=1 Tax=Stylosanthes scabra TaxID=79078 RepID=A0ABU6X7B7_9FABA|nr:hypothetical protein [Stylosanthes scabra]